MHLAAVVHLAIRLQFRRPSQRAGRLVTKRRNTQRRRHVADFAARLDESRVHASQHRGVQHQDRQPGGLPVQHAVRRSVLIAADLCARRVRRVRVDAGHVERAAVHVGDVSRRIQDEGRTVRDDLVELRRRQVARRLQENRIELAAHDPLVGTGRRGHLLDFPNGIECILERRRLERAHVPEVAQSGQQREVHMGLDESRQDGATIQIDDAGIRPRGGHDGVVAADGEHLVTPDRERLVLREAGIDRQDDAVPKDQRIRSQLRGPAAPRPGSPRGKVRLRHPYPPE